MKKYLFFSLMIFMISVFVTGCSKKAETATYTLYVGLNDKDTNTQLIPTEDAQKIILDVATKYTSGGSIYPAKGFWKDEKCELTIENDFVCIFADVSYEAVTKVADELLEELNQNSILITKNVGEVELYSRKN